MNRRSRDSGDEGHPPAAAPEYREDPITGQWVLIAPARARRPILEAAAGVLDDDPSLCPFCEGKESSTPPELAALRAIGPANGPGWTVRVVPNRYPAVGGTPAEDPSEVELFRVRSGEGRHEVVLERPDHSWTTSDLSAERIGSIFGVYADRLRALAADPRVGYALVFKNAGLGAGASQIHAHSQILATTELPPRIAQELDGARAFQRARGEPVYSALIDRELSERTRLVVQSERFLAFCPFASRFPFETWVLPRAPSSRFERHPRGEFGELGEVVKTLLLRLEKVMARPAYNYYLHTAPLDAADHGYYHWHVEVAPRIVGLAGCEVGGGLFINPLPPERAAALLRDAVARDAP